MQPDKTEKPAADASLANRIARFAPTEVKADVARLSPADRQALDKILEAARLMDEIFLRQVWNGNVALRSRLEADSTPAGLERLHYFRLNAGPWSRLDHDAPFLEGVPAKPPQASYYPDDMTRDEFQRWAESLKDDDARRAVGFFTVIRRDAAGKLKAIPYSEEYKEFLTPAAARLREAARLTGNGTLRTYLNARADAFSSNDYYASDLAWMDLDAPLEVTIGPYETYEDGLMNYKAAFEAFVTLRDDEASDRLARFGSHLQEIENHLPVDPKYRNPHIGAAAPIRVVDEIFCSGDARHGVQTAAFNLPNDEQVIQKKGSKRVMLRNVQEAKFKTVLIPIADRLLDPGQRAQVSFDAFFTHILSHELMHGLGPHNIQVDGRGTTVRLELRDAYSPIEEAKADITGLFALQYLIDRGALERSLESQMYVTFLASMFRSVRFGINEAHGKAVALQLNYLIDQGAIRFDSQRVLFSIDASRIAEATRRLTGELLTLEAQGAYEKAKAMLDRYGVVRPEIQKALDQVVSVPVDIEPIFAVPAR